MPLKKKLLALFTVAGIATAAIAASLPAEEECCPSCDECTDCATCCPSACD